MASGSIGIGIDIGGNFLRMVQIEKRQEGYAITAALKLLVSEIAEDDYNVDADTAGALSSALKAAGIDGRKRAIGISGKDLILRYTEVPQVPDWRLKMIMDFEIAEIAGRAGGDLSADFQLLNIPQNESGNFTVMVALAKNQFLHQRLDALAGAGLAASDMCPSSLALFNSFVMNEDVVPGETTLVVDIGARNTEMFIQKDGALLFARNVSAGGNLFTRGIVENLRIPFPEAEKIKKNEGSVSRKGGHKAMDPRSEAVYGALTAVAQQFAALLRSSVMFCKSQTKMQDLNVTRILLSGGGSRLKGLKESLGQAFGVPCDVLNPMKNVVIEVDDPEVEEKIVESPREWAVAIGLARIAMGEGSMGLRLLPEEFKKKRQFREKSVFMIASGAVAVIMLGLLMFGAVHNLGVQENYLKETDRSLKSARSQQKAIEEIKAMSAKTADFLNVLAAEASSGGEFMQVNSWIALNAPAEIWLKSVSFKRQDPATIRQGDGMMTITGVVEQSGGDPGQKLTEFARQLKDLPQVREAKITNRSTDLGKTAFTLQLLLGALPPGGKGGAKESEED